MLIYTSAIHSPEEKVSPEWPGPIEPWRKRQRANTTGVKSLEMWCCIWGFSITKLVWCAGLTTYSRDILWQISLTIRNIQLRQIIFSFPRTAVLCWQSAFVVITVAQMWAVYSLVFWYLAAEQIKTSWHFLWVLMNHNHTQVQQQQTVFPFVLFLLFFPFIPFFPNLAPYLHWFQTLTQLFRNSICLLQHVHLISLSFCLQNPSPQPQPVRSNT